MKKMILLGLMTVTTCSLLACVFNPVAYDELRQQEHQDHLKQNGY